MDTHNNTVAHVEHAGDINDSTRQSLMQKIKEKFPNVTEVAFEVNEDLIAGIRISYQDYMYEDSVKAKLQELQNANN